MKTWFEIVAKYNALDEKGKHVAITENYLIDAVTYTDAEARGIEYIGAEVGGFDLHKITKTAYNYVIINEDYSFFHKVKVCYKSVDSDSEKESNVVVMLLVQSDTVEQANTQVNEFYEEMINSFEIKSVSNTKIIDVFEYLN